MSYVGDRGRELVQKRIFGVETEYGIIFTPEGRKTLPVEKAIRFLFEKLITTEHFLNVFLENGARFYQDTGCHPEYATPECASPRQLIVYDKAGERILEDLQNYAEEKIREERIAGKLSIFKNNTDFVGNSYGCHENYLVDRDVDFYYLAEQLIPFLVTRQIYTGAGKVFQTQDGVHYCVSQRAQHIYQKISGTTTNDRSIINTRDEPHADREKYRRLHVIVGDSNMSEYTNFLKIGSCAVVLQMIEDNYINKDFTLRNPVKAIKDISYDTTCKRKLRLDNGREYSPIEIQREYCEMAQKYVEQYPVSDELRLAVGMWQEMLDDLDDDPNRLSRKIDWVIKRTLIESFIEQKGTRWNDSRVFMLDLQYHDIRVNRGLYYLLERRGAVDRVLDRRRGPEGEDRAAAGHARAHARRVHQARAPERHPVRPRLVEHPPRQPPERARDLQQPVRDRHREGRGAGAHHPEDEPAQDEPLEARDPVVSEPGRRPGAPAPRRRAAAGSRLAGAPRRPAGRRRARCPRDAAGSGCWPRLLGLCVAGLGAGGPRARRSSPSAWRPARRACARAEARLAAYDAYLERRPLARAAALRHELEGLAGRARRGSGRGRAARVIPAHRIRARFSRASRPRCAQLLPPLRR